MLLYGLIIFIAAFLLFQLQPLIAKIILPWFGGSSTVWSTCMLFFQSALLLGYLYAHWLQGRRAVKKQAAIHTLLLAASLGLLPILPGASWKNSDGGDPAWRILGLLAATVGLPYFLLSTTSPLLQAWYARTRPGAVPYRLFALSNLASMLGLLTYPVLIEPNLSTVHQAQVWSAAYACFAVLCAARAWKSAAAPVVAREPAGGGALGDSPAPGWGLRLLWTALPACASILLLSITTYLTQDVAAVPFLWILPLAVYLLSFILCFEAPRWYARRVYLALLVPALGLMAYMLSEYRAHLNVVQKTIIAAGSLFVFAMVCHGEAARRKPHPRYLTMFYLMLSAGGALGGFFVGLVAPNLFDAYYELPMGLALCAALAATVLLSEHRAFFRRSPNRPYAVALLAAVVGYFAALGYVVRESVEGYRVVARNFYGQLRVLETDDEDGLGLRRKLYHGVINHGEQILAGELRRKPGTYFCTQTAIGRVLLAGQAGAPRRVGVLGLGCGTLAAYGRPGDTLRIYEINPTVVRLSRTEFTYLRDTPARIEIVPGDARLSLEREPDQHFDVLVMDAFSGDSVPVHLITREAFRTYLRHLKPEGVLAVNISNQYLDLRPVMERAANAFGKLAIYCPFTAADEDTVCYGASWVLIVSPETKAALPAGGPGEVLPPRPDFPVWTDDFSSLHRILK